MSPKPDRQWTKRFINCSVCFDGNQQQALLEKTNRAVYRTVFLYSDDANLKTKTKPV